MRTIINYHFSIFKKKQLGFTLIELLTVIAIIGILTGLLTVSYITVRQRGRDAQRKSDVKQIQSALELYRADNDQYPTSLSTGTSPAYTYNCSSATSVPFVNPTNTTTYMSKIPCDPSVLSPYYYYQGSTTTYVIASCAENTGDKDAVSSAAGSKPTYWPSGAAWPPVTSTNCPSQYFYVSSNP